MFFTTLQDTNGCTYKETHHSCKYNVCTGVRSPTWGVMQDTVFWKPSTFYLNIIPMPVLGKARFVCYQTGNVPLWSAPCPREYPLGGSETECAVLRSWPVYFCTHGEFWIHCLKVSLSLSQLQYWCRLASAVVWLVSMSFSSTLTTSGSMLRQSVLIWSRQKMQWQHMFLNPKQAKKGMPSSKDSD